jgi:hypothetical protein
VKILAFSSLVLATAACSESFKTPPPPEMTAVIVVTSDPGVPLANASIESGGKTITMTDALGHARLKLTGREGETFEFNVRCPEGYASPSKPLVVMLRPQRDSAKWPEYPTSCPKTRRSAVVAVRAENGPNLPVKYLGKEIGRTDESGAATLLLADLDATQTFTLMLDYSELEGVTSKTGTKQKEFHMAGRDEFFFFDLPLVLPPKKIVYGPYRAGPTHL